MNTVKLLFMLIVGLALILVVVQNTTPVQTRFLWMSAQVPAILLLLLTAAGGFVLGLLVALLTRKGGTSRQ